MRLAGSALRTRRSTCQSSPTSWSDRSAGFSAGCQGRSPRAVAFPPFPPGPLIRGLPLFTHTEGSNCVIRNNPIEHARVVGGMHRRPLAAILLLIVVAVAGCGPSANPSTSPTPSPTATPTPTPQVACADQVFAAMTLDQRIGQLLELGLASDRIGST